MLLYFRDLEHRGADGCQSADMVLPDTCADISPKDNSMLTVSFNCLCWHQPEGYTVCWHYHSTVCADTSLKDIQYADTIIQLSVLTPAWRITVSNWRMIVCWHVKASSHYSSLRKCWHRRISRSDQVNSVTVHYPNCHLVFHVCCIGYTMLCHFISSHDWIFMCLFM